MRRVDQVGDHEKGNWEHVFFQFFPMFGGVGLGIPSVFEHFFQGFYVFYRVYDIQYLCFAISAGLVILVVFVFAQVVPYFGLHMFAQDSHSLGFHSQVWRCVSSARGFCREPARGS